MRRRLRGIRVAWVASTFLVIALLWVVTNVVAWDGLLRHRYHRVLACSEGYAVDGHCAPNPCMEHWLAPPGAGNECTVDPSGNRVWR
jgi:hypothetical protein